jgi:hypothetical protein
MLGRERGWGWRKREGKRRMQGVDSADGEGEHRKQRRWEELAQIKNKWLRERCRTSSDDTRWYF